MSSPYRSFCYTCRDRLQAAVWGMHCLPSSDRVFLINSCVLQAYTPVYTNNCVSPPVQRLVKTLVADAPLTAVDFMPDGATLAVGSSRGKIYQYDLRMLKSPVKTITAHKTSVQCIAFQYSTSLMKVRRSLPYFQVSKKSLAQKMKIVSCPRNTTLYCFLVIVYGDIIHSFNIKPSET